MTDQLVSFETAKLAKEKGFQLQRNYFGYIDKFYHPITQCIRSYGMTGRTNKDILIYIPTQSLLQKWLREKHGVKVVVDTDMTLSWIHNIQSLHPQASYTGLYIESNNVYSTYEEALEPGLYRALELIP